MYLDTNNFVKELPYKRYCFKNNKRILVDYHCKYYLSCSIEKSEDEEVETLRIFELLSNDHTFVIKEFISALFLEHKDIDVVYTRLDLSQTFSQVRRNKYFKVASGKRQLIFEE